MKKVNAVFFLLVGAITQGLFAAEDVAFDFETNAFHHLDNADTGRVKRTYDTFSTDFFLDDGRRRDQFFTMSLTAKPDDGQLPSQRPLVNGDSVQDQFDIIDPQSFQQDISLRDRATLDALEDDNVFFRHFSDDEKTTLTPLELYRIQLGDCRELIDKSAYGLREVNVALYRSMEPAFGRVKNQVTELMSKARIGDLQEGDLILAENSIKSLQSSLDSGIAGHLFKVLILDALQLAIRKLYHVRITLVKYQLKDKHKKKYLDKAEKDSIIDREEIQYFND